MTSLHVFRDHPVPLDIVMQRIVVLGTSGAGKTSGQRSLAERVWRDHKLRFGVFDLAEDWWGLKSSADGNSPGIPVVIFGGDHANLPLPTTGTEFARIVAKLEQPWIADLKALTKPKRLTFIGEANLELLRVNKGNPVVIFYDECDSYAPETSKSKEGFFSGDATEEVFKRGRKQGIFPVGITQRNAAISKDVVDLCQVALLYRAPGVIDQKVAVGYLGNSVSKKDADAILIELEHLPDGECYLVSKAPKMTMMLRVKVLQPTTFDSSATPKLGERRREPKVLAEPDLEKIRAQMAKDIEEAKQDDPVELRKTITTLRRELATRPKDEVERVVEKVVERPVLKDEQIARLERALVHADDIAEKFLTHRESIFTAATEIRSGLDTVRAARSVAPTPALLTGHRTAVARPVAAPSHNAVVGGPVRAESNGELPGTQQRILNVMATLETLGYEQPSRPQVGIWLRVKATTGSFKNYLGALRSAGLLTYVSPGDKGRLELTAAGRAAAIPEDIPTAEELRNRVLSIFRNKTIEVVLRTLIAHYPNPVARYDLARTAGVDHTTGSFKNYLGALRSAGLIEYVTPGDEGTVVAQSILRMEAA